MSNIVANHAHVFPASMNPNGTIDRLLKLMDACDIAQCICFAPFPHACDTNGLTPNRWLVDAIRGNDRLRAFGTVDVRRGDVADQVKEAFDLGCLGLKMHPNAQGFAILSPVAMKAYEAAEKLGMFITFHSGVHRTPLKDVRVLMFDEVGWRFPNLRFSMEHIGGPHFFTEALAVLFNHLPTPWAPEKSNVFGGLASIFSSSVNRFWYLGPTRLAELVAQIDATQLIFGLDFPYNLEAETKLGIDTIRAFPLPPEKIDLILGGNLRRELKLK
jgi:predicted TIM-barrel fold metal-dependent hydrolase